MLDSKEPLIDILGAEDELTTVSIDGYDELGSANKDLNSRRGQMYFLTHGESRADESNRNAANIWVLASEQRIQLTLHCAQDVGLTTFGELQARLGARAILQQGLRFDEIHCSNLQRAKQTMAIVVEVCERVHSQ